MKKIVLFLIIIISYVTISNIVDLKPNLNLSNKKNLTIKGIDISHHNVISDWNKIDTNIKFVFIKSTEGKSFKDPKFDSNWKNAKKHGFIRGAYHFFSPNISAEEQFLNFKNNVKLSKGDLPPVVDVEVRDIDMNEVNKWIKLVEDHYGIKPIIYSDYLYFKVLMDNKVDNCKLWIHIDEKYHLSPSFNNYDCVIWQYSHTGNVDGIDGEVDLNHFILKNIDIKELTIK